MWFLSGWSLLGTPAIGVDGTVYAVAREGQLRAITPEGKVKWFFDFGGSAANFQESNPAIGPDGTVYVAFGTKIYAVRPDGSQRWVFPAAGILSDVALAADGSVIYAASASGYLCAMKLDGNQQWALPLTSGSNVTGPLPGSTVVGPAGTIYTVLGFLYAVDALGNKKWSFPADLDAAFATCEGAPALAEDGTIYVGCGANLFALDANGRERWRVPLTSTTAASFTLGSNGSLFLSDANRILVISSQGVTQSLWPLDRYTSSAGAIGADGKLYFEANPAANGQVWVIGP